MAILLFRSAKKNPKNLVEHVETLAVVLNIAGQPVLTCIISFGLALNISAYFIIWTGIISQIRDFDLLVQKDFSISVLLPVKFR